MQPSFVWLGHHPCLDFINTELMGAGGRKDLLQAFPDLVYWLTSAKLVDAEAGATLRKKWHGSSAASRALHLGRELRSMLREMAERIAAGRGVPQTALRAINSSLGADRGHRKLVRRHGRFVERFHRDYSKAETLLVPVAEAASHLLCECDLSRIRKCENPSCILFFYDQSKNGSRRWCSMEFCGNRHKAAAFYHRHRRSCKRGTKT